MTPLVDAVCQRQKARRGWLREVRVICRGRAAADHETGRGPHHARRDASG
jgi:hypothetical protein